MGNELDCKYVREVTHFQLEDIIIMLLNKMPTCMPTADKSKCITITDERKNFYIAIRIQLKSTKNSGERKN